MRTIPLPGTNEPISRIGLGTWAFDGRDWGGTDERAAVETVRRAIDLGVTLIDTAPAYGLGHSEEVLGRAIEGLRDRVFLATKVGIRWNAVHYYQDLSPGSIREECEQSLRRLRTDRIDLLQIHWPHSESPLEASLRALDDLRRAGMIRHIGVSNFDVPLLEAACAVVPIETLQPPLHLFFRNSEERILPYCAEQGIPALVYGPLCKGLLTGKFADRPIPDDIRTKDPFFGPTVLPLLRPMLNELWTIASRRGLTLAQLALSWALSRPGVAAAIVGARSPEQIQETASAAAIDLGPETAAEIENVVRDVPRVVP